MAFTYFYQNTHNKLLSLCLTFIFKAKHNTFAFIIFALLKAYILITNKNRQERNIFLN